jgi:hypothetical protein
MSHEFDFAAIDSILVVALPQKFERQSTGGNYRVS